MRQSQRASCSELGVEKYIRDDLTPGFCRINQKRLDATLDEKVEVMLEIKMLELFYEFNGTKEQLGVSGKVFFRKKFSGGRPSNPTSNLNSH